MSEGARALGFGIHELLRYAIPGYTFLLVFYLPFILTENQVTTFQTWEQLVPIFLVAGLIIGYLIFYPYYIIFRNKFDIPDNRVSLRVIMTRLRKTSPDIEVRAIQDMALNKEEGEIATRCRFLFSSFHSIGTTLLSIWGGFICSFIFIMLNLTKRSPEPLLVEGIISILLIVLSIVLIREYIYRRDLAFEIEDRIILEHINEIIPSEEEQ